MSAVVTYPLARPIKDSSWIRDCRSCGNPDYVAAAQDEFLYGGIKDSSWLRDCRSCGNSGYVAAAQDEFLVWRNKCIRSFL